MTARIVGVHGIAQQTKGGPLLRDDWYPAMSSGVERADGALDPSDLDIAFYGDLFRPEARTLDQPESIDVRDELDLELLAAWWREAARTDPTVVPPDAETLGTPRWVQRALLALTYSSYFSGIALRMMPFAVAQLRHYLTDDAIRGEVQRRIAAAVTPDTRVLVAHSLGSVAAYEALCRHPEWPVRALVTLGSPLGVPNLVYHRLRPAPAVDHRTGRLVGRWPGAVRTWTNIAADNDVVALVKDLRPVFGPAVHTILPYNGSAAHDAKNYLTDKATGQAILNGLEC